MDVRMPDGTVVQNVPDGITQEELQALLSGEKPKDKPEDLGIKSARDLWRLASSPLDAIPGSWNAAMGLSRGTQQIFARPLAQVGEWIEPKLSSLITGKNEPILGAWSRALDAEQAAADARRPKNPTPAYKAGELATEVGLTALPFMAAAKPAQILTKTPLMQTVPGAFAGGTAVGAAEPSKGSEEQAFNAMFGGVLSAGGQKAADVVVPWIAGPVKSKLDDLGKRAVDLAKEHGFDVSPGQESGSGWRQLVETVWRNLPLTAGREQKRALANQDLLQSKVDALNPNMPQATAADQAIEGYNTGVGQLKSGLEKEYDDLLTGKDINYEGARGPLELSRREALKRSPNNRGGSAYDEVNEWLGDPNYAQKTRKPFVVPRVDPSKDDFVTAVRKLGGIDPTDPHLGRDEVGGLRFSPDPRLGPVWAKKTYGSGTTHRQLATRGHSLEDMAQKLHQEGYISDPAALDEILDKLRDSWDGQATHRSIYFDHGAEQAAVDPLERLAAVLEAKKAPPPPKAGWIRDSDNPVDGRVAQGERSAFTTKAEAAADKDRYRAQVYSELRGAVDIAIERSLPQAERGKFADINKRWGIYEALKQQTPKNQATFLENLYAGTGGNAKLFFDFLKLAPEGQFDAVSKGFLSNLIEKATSAEGRIGGKALARSIDSADPDALKLFGGREEGRKLWELGQIGSSVLPDKIPNSGTAQRWFMQGLLTGGVGMGVDWDNPIGTGAQIGGSLVLPKVLQSLYYGAHNPAAKRALAAEVRRLGPTMARALGLQAVGFEQAEE